MASIIKTFYEAFDRLDWQTMTNCYHRDITFQDPAFGQLKGERAKLMWRMLCESQQGQDFNIQFSNITENETSASAQWEAHYTFSKTGRKVHNVIQASFQLKDGKIIAHNDDFNLYRWAKQALGFKGFVLGRTGFFKSKLQHQTNNLLNKFERKIKKKESC